jgi:predicted phosphodiesterase
VIGALGDIHGAFDAARQIIATHPDVPFWLCVGDIADEMGRYESLGAPVYWIHGNNDNFDAIASGDLPEDLHHIDNGTMITIGASKDAPYGGGNTGASGDAPYGGGNTGASGDAPDDARIGASKDAPYGRKISEDVGHVFRRASLTVAGLGGTFAPTWYETAAADLPHPKKGSAKATELADKRRHVVRAEVEACKALRDIDIFMTHEAPKPFRPFPGGRGPDAGKVQVNEILAAMQPRLHLFGHHHRFSEQTVEGVRSLGLDLVTRSYLLIDPATFDLELVTVKY